jgi:hypothetical protein
MSDLIYPTLKLFIYDLQEGLGDNQDQLQANRDCFLRNLPVSVHQKVIQCDTTFQSDYIELLGRDKINRFHTTFKSKKIDGFYYPVRLNDTYSLLLDCSIDNKKNPQVATASIALLKKQINEKVRNKSGILGQTWMIAGCLPNYTAKSSEAIAQECYKSLIPDGDWEEDYQGQGIIFGGNIFELWRRTSSQDDHVIIIFYPNLATEETAASFNFDWLPLFCYRHKIMRAYSQSQYIKTLLKQDFIKIKEEYLGEVPQKDSQWLNFSKLRSIAVKAQKTLAQYSINLGYLENQINTIEINLLNYQRCLARMKEKTASEAFNLFVPEKLLSQIPTPISNLMLTGSQIYSLIAQLARLPVSSDLMFLENFSNEVTQKYLLQVQKDNANLSPGLRLLENLINSIRGVVEINQAEQDRTFQYWAGMLGVGLTSGAMAVSVAVDQLKANDKPIDNPIRSWLCDAISLPKCQCEQQVPNPWWFEAVIPLMYGVGIGFIFAALTWLIMMILLRRRLR